MTVYNNSLLAFSNVASEDQELTMACMQNIKKHLVRLVNAERQTQYVNNLDILEDMIQTQSDSQLLALSA